MFVTNRLGVSNLKPTCQRVVSKLVHTWNMQYWVWYKFEAISLIVPFIWYLVLPQSIACPSFPTGTSCWPNAKTWHNVTLELPFENILPLSCSACIVTSKRRHGSRFRSDLVAKVHSHEWSYCIGPGRSSHKSHRYYLFMSLVNYC